MKCTICSPLEKKTEDALTGIFVETVTGHRGILKDHMPIVVELRTGSYVRVKMNIGEVRYKIGASSFFKFSENEGIVLTQTFQQEEQQY